MLPVSAENREGAGIAAGDKVEVDLELDTQPRDLVVPPDLAKALKRDAAAKKFFDSLSYSKKQRFTLPIDAAQYAPELTRRPSTKAVRDRSP